jgi:hypothetical protein
MANWTDTSKKRLLESTLAEPKTKTARLRSLLAELLQVQAAGANAEEIMKFLDAQGVRFPSKDAFYKAFERAKRAGVLAPVSVEQQSAQVSTSNTKAEKEAPSYNQKTDRNASTPALMKDGEYVVPVISVVSKDVRIDKNPNLDELF